MIKTISATEIDKRLYNIQDQLDIMEEPKRELAFAMLAVDETDAATLDWLATCAIECAAEIRGERANG